MSKSYRRKNKIEGQFAPRLIEMLESPAYRVLSRAAFQVLARMEIELAHHGGMDNGKLPVTFDDCVAYGVHRRMIAPAIRELVALGFLEITEQGRAGNAEFRRPSKYRITYRHADRANPTHEWRHITEDDAGMIAKGARRPRSNSAYRWPKATSKINRNPVAQSAPQLGDTKCTTDPGFHSAQSATTTHGAQTATTLDTIGEVVGDVAGDLVGQPEAVPCPDPAETQLQPPDAPASPWDDLDIPPFLQRHS